MSAEYIKNDENKLYTCNICSENIKNDNIIGLKCNPTKHIFCYECILDWYKELNRNKNINNYNIKNMCPICRKNGGLLPINNNYKIIKNIHNMKEINLNVSNLPNVLKNINSLIINPDKLLHECGVKFKTKNGYCKFKGKEC